jgi:cystathionine gamma-lyase
MASSTFESPIDRHTPLHGPRRVDQETLDAFGMRAVHVGSDPDPSTGAVIPAISLSTTYKQHSVGNYKVSGHRYTIVRHFFGNLSGL